MTIMKRMIFNTRHATSVNFGRYYKIPRGMGYLLNGTTFIVTTIP